MTSQINTIIAAERRADADRTTLRDGRTSLRDVVAMVFLAGVAVLALTRPCARARRRVPLVS
jgi:hypothetical protein